MSNEYIDLRPLTALDWTPEKSDKPYEPFALVYDVDRWIVISKMTGGKVYFSGDGPLMASEDKAAALEALRFALDFPRAVEVGPGPVEQKEIAASHAEFVRGLAAIIAGA